MSDEGPRWPEPAAPSALPHQIEALLFLSPQPVSVARLCELTESAPGPVQRAIRDLRERLRTQSGLELAEVAGGVTLRTRAELAEVCDRLRARPPEDRLSPAALETLAVVAYLEPVSRPQISHLRGVQADSLVASLVDRGLLEEAGRGDGGAMRYRTTAAFQERFDLAGPGGLPPIERFELSGPEAQQIRERMLAAGHLVEDGEDGDGG